MGLFAKLCEFEEVTVLRPLDVIVLPVVDIPELVLQLVSEILDL